MNKRMNNMWHGAKLGGLLGGAVGTILAGVPFIISDGRKVVVVETAISAATAASRSCTAVGTIIGAVSGAFVQEDGCRASKKVR